MITEAPYQVGDATITRIPELQLSGFTPSQLIPAWDEARERLLPRLPPAATDATGEHVILNVHSWLVRDRGRTILIDTGSGNDKQRPFAPYFHNLHTPFLERLALAGVVPEEVDYVLLTHLHVDHVGWNTRLQDGCWIPTFPNARYVFSQAEYAYFSDPANLSARNRTSFAVRVDSVDPIIAAGLADMVVVDGSEILEGISFHLTPGHTQAHASIVLRSACQTAIFPGDVMHYPVQVTRPHWNSLFDAFAEDSIRSRAWALAFAADNQAGVFSSHFPASGAGRVQRIQGGFAWRFENGVGA